jgi:hypothetical protein
MTSRAGTPVKTGARTGQEISMTSATSTAAKRLLAPAPWVAAEGLRKILLLSGVMSSVVYVAANVVGALRWEGYSSVSQAVSELSAIDAPSRPVMISFMLAYSVLFVGFGFGVRASAESHRALRIVAALLVGYGLFCLTGPLFPMHQRGAEGSLTDILHIIGAIIDVLFILLIIGFAANAFGKIFRLYSITTIAVLLMFGTLAGLDGPRIALNLPTPWLGVSERISIFAFLLWVVFLSLHLFRAVPRPSLAPLRSQ